jgi:hypothetical protein
MEGILPIWRNSVKISESRFQTRGYGNLRFEEFGDGAAGFGGFHGGVELGFIGAGDLGDQIEMTFGDAKAIANLFEADGGSGLELLSSQASTAQLGGECHGESPGVGSGEQLLGIGADSIFETGAEGILGLLEDPAIGGNSAFAGLEVTLPDGTCFALHD